MTTIMFAIDPGYAYGSAIAVFSGTRLVRVLFDVDAVDARKFGTAGARTLGTPDLVVVEQPEHRANEGHAAATVLRLAWEGALLAGRLAGRHARVVAYTPTAWKGSVPKPIAHANLWDALSVAERKLLGGKTTHAMIERAVERGAVERWKRPGAAYYPSTWVTHNLLDAVALGRHYLTKTGKLT